MTIEEKAKRYDEALERAKALIAGETNTSDALFYLNDIKNIFPELKESEDEIIRKSIIEFFESQDDNTTYSLVPKKDILAWLEKQVKQEPIDKVESKFKVGDWIISSVLGIARIIGVNDSNEYQLEYIDGKQKFSSIDYVNYEYDKWAIKDAEEGDVLVYNNSSVEIILLFEKWMNGIGKGAYSYAHTFNNKIVFDDWSDCGYATHPATKEQREFLFEKMREAGYEWNFEKKELMQIEKQGEQKSIWGEEDENFFANICSIIDSDRKFTESAKRRCKDWLKSLKDRVQHQNVWKPSKEQIIALRWVLNNIPYNKHKEEISGLLDQIKDLCV